MDKGIEKIDIDMLIDKDVILTVPLLETESKIGLLNNLFIEMTLNYLFRIL